MRRITLLCVGKLKERFYIQAAEEYAKRLGRYCKLEVLELPEQRLGEAPSPAEVQRALAREAEALRGRLSGKYIALCVEGRMRSSEEIPQMFPVPGRSPEKHMVFIIGGSYGLHPSIKAEASLQLSMSPMTFPHHLARVMLLEQIYRSFKIEEGSSYHK